MRKEFYERHTKEEWADLFKFEIDKAVSASLDDRVARWFLADQWSRIKHTVTDLQECESPIEQLMYLSLKRSIRLLGSIYGAELWLIFCPQYEVESNGKKYRLDFYIHAKVHDNEVHLAIECDGHDFHERTKEQAVRDKSRDRALTERGFVPIRFTGSEIWRDPNLCAKQVENIIENRLLLR